MAIQLHYSRDAASAPLSVTLPLSKSIALRVLTLNALSRRLTGREAAIPSLPDAGDVAGMLRAMRLYDSGGAPSGRNTVHIGEGGAPLRFFLPLAASTPGLDMTVSAGLALSRRPLAPLLTALRDAGADVRPLRRQGRPPLRIIGQSLSPGEIVMDPGVSSQFVSALMMASPLWGRGLSLDFGGRTPVSAPYIAMTASLMERYSARIEHTGSHICVAPRHISPPDRMEIETDWSAVSYFYQLALLLPGTPIHIDRLTPPAVSLQGDARCAGIFSSIGVATEIHPDGNATLLCDAARLRRVKDSGIVLHYDMDATPDLVPALAVGFCLAGLKFRFTGVAHLRHKETDRMLAPATELARLGYRLRLEADAMGWEGEKCAAEEQPMIQTWSDHRMAMAFAPSAVIYPGLRIEHPQVVGKSFPRYWEMLGRLGFIIAPA